MIYRSRERIRTQRSRGSECKFWLAYVMFGQLMNLGVLVSLWFGLSYLLVVARGNLRPSLRQPSVAQSMKCLRAPERCFDRLLVGAFVPFVVVILATWYRRTDVVGVLLIGPVIAFSIAVFGEQWTDPNWFQVVAVSKCAG